MKLSYPPALWGDSGHGAEPQPQLSCLPCSLLLAATSSKTPRLQEWWARVEAALGTELFLEAHKLIL